MIKPPFRSQHGGSARRTRIVAWATLLVLLGLAWLFRHVLYTSWTLVSLPVNWRDGAEDFVLSKAHDDFDITFVDYDKHQLSAAPHPDVVPPILHHIALGKRHWRDGWQETVQSCIDMHPGWEARMWTDETASAFVAERFPELLDMWNAYPYPVERVDALRYMVLYEFGGVILDMDLKCKRALGPLRRFDFVAPEAQPVGFSIGFMMAARRNDFVGAIVRNLTTYNRQWLGLPYPSVMFSTGCHYASVIHLGQANRTNLKILPGPMHSLSGRVTTPLFDHLGSSSCHSYDARLIITLGHGTNLLFFVGVGIALALFWRRRTILRRL